MTHTSLFQNIISSLKLTLVTFSVNVATADETAEKTVDVSVPNLNSTLSTRSVPKRPAKVAFWVCGIYRTMDSLKYRSNYDWMLFLTPPMVIMGFKPRTSKSQVLMYMLSRFYLKGKRHTFTITLKN